MSTNTTTDMDAVYVVMEKELREGRQPGSHKRIATLAGIPLQRVKDSIRLIIQTGWLVSWQADGRYTPTQYGIPGEDIVEVQATPAYQGLDKRPAPQVVPDMAPSPQDIRIVNAIIHAQREEEERKAYERIIAHNPPPARTIAQVLQQAMAMAVHHGTIEPGGSLFGIRARPVPPQVPAPECPSCGRVFWPKPREIMCIVCQL